MLFSNACTYFFLEHSRGRLHIARARSWESQLYLPTPSYIWRLFFRFNTRERSAERLYSRYFVPGSRVQQRPGSAEGELSLANWVPIFLCTVQHGGV